MRANTSQTIRQRIAEHAEAVARLDDSHIEAIERAADLLNRCVREGGCIFVCGNGGSAADAQHIAGEIVGRFLVDRAALPCVALSTDTSVMTSVANDYGYELVFARQVQGLMRPGDVLWALSTSGNSPNILRAIEMARQRRGRVVGFSGGDGGAMTGLCDACFVAPAQGSFAVQQLHQIAYHALCELLEADGLHGKGKG